ncbi:MAG: hypothetical protein INR65_17385 [Gluconacetobacter diazotrophicus]|nr:hypothetical protein [Gluconacetobacter diazotrophicus]
MAILLAASASGARPARAAPGEWTQEVRGTVGPYRVGGALVVRDGRVFEAGHYFYASRLANIPLRGTMHGGELELTEPGGGTFRLRLVHPGATGPVTEFGNATGLDGSWSGNGRTLPVRLDFDWGAPGPWPVRRYGDVTADPDAVFEGKVRRFVAAVLSGDRTAASGFVSYPLRVNGAAGFVVRTRVELPARWDAVFTPAVLAALRAAIPHEMFVRNGQAMIGNGQAWFDAAGLCAVNPG